MRPDRFDIRLLTALEAIERLGSLTLAGEELGLSQPALSHGLARLRALVDDELFVRTPRGMRPTVKGEALAGSARRIIDVMRTELAAALPFDPATSTRAFTVCMSDVGELVFLPQLLARLRQAAPSINLAVVSLAPRELFDALGTGAADLAIGFFPDLVASGLQRQKLFERGFLTLYAPTHPRIREQALDLDGFLAEPHLVVRSQGRTEEVFERRLRERGMKRRVLLTVPHMFSVPTVIAGSDLLVTVPHSVGTALCRDHALRSTPPPLDSPAIEVFQHWSPRVERDPANQWLRQTVCELFRDA